MVSTVVVAGFATLDYVARADGVFTGRGTLSMRQGAPDAWPRAGGAALYASAALTRAGVVATPLTWIGEDVDGQAYLAACRAARVAPDGVAVISGAASTRCLLIYSEGGEYGCLLRPGTTWLDQRQARMAAAAPWFVVTAGPQDIMRRLLQAAPACQGLAWIAKDDPACFPADMVATLTARVQVVFCNRDERAWLEAGRTSPRPAEQILFETRGAEGVRVERGGEIFHAPVEPLAMIDDATGAGDTFAGAALAALIGGADPLAAARAGTAAARALLASRTLP